MRIGVVADIHCGPDRDSLPGSRSPVLLDAFVDAMKAFRPDCVVDLGDRINSVANGQDRVRTLWVRRRLCEVGVPVYHVLGNTDVQSLGKEAAVSALGKPAPCECVDLGVGRGALRLLLLDTVDPAVEGVGGAVGPDQLTWLADRLGEGRLPCLVCAHHPFDEPALDGHRYFEERPDLAAVSNRGEVRSLFERSGCVRGVLTGHLHWSRTASIEGIPYIAIGSLVESAYTGGEPCGAFGLVTVEPGSFEVAVSGRQPARWTF